jgi:hypothetical protein
MMDIYLFNDELVLVSFAVFVALVGSLEVDGV